MGNQAKKTSKRRRKARALKHIVAQDSRKENRIELTSKKGHAKSKRYGERTMDCVAPKHIKAQTFQDEYNTYRKTRGRRGLSPDPTKREEENINVTRRNSVLACGSFPIGELMEKPVRAYDIKRSISRR